MLQGTNKIISREDIWDTNLEHTVNVQIVLCLLQSAYLMQKNMKTDYN